MSRIRYFFSLGSGVHVLCVHMMCIWCTSGVHLVYIWCTSGVHLVYIWCTSGLYLMYILKIIYSYNTSYWLDDRSLLKLVRYLLAPTISVQILEVMGTRVWVQSIRALLRMLQTCPHLVVLYSFLPWYWHSIHSVSVAGLLSEAGSCPDPIFGLRTAVRRGLETDR